MNTQPHTDLRGPRATYRLQLNGSFGFVDATAVVSYLDALGVSHCYCSPYLKSRSGSRHGYDVIDHNAVDPDIGTMASLDRFCTALAERGMGQILDIVPNHMAVMGRDNPWWQDVLENGPASSYARFFDIDWAPLRASLTDKVLLPVLGDHYGTILEGGDLTLVFNRAQGSFAFEYHEHLFPVDPREYAQILSADIAQLRASGNACSNTFGQVEALIAAFSDLPGRSVRDPALIERRRRDSDLLRNRLADLVARHAAIDEYIGQCVDAFNATPRSADGLDRIHRLLEAQAYRLAYWRVASHEINYRRFFDISDLACLRMESAAVFDATHRLVVQLVASGRVNGLRVDHSDGLYDPAAYFDRLQTAIDTASDGRRTAPDGQPTYIVTEKILGHGERLPEGWRIHGTTGYEFADLVTRLFVHPNGMPRLTRFYSEFTGDDSSFSETAYSARKLIMQTSLASELNVLVTALDRIAEADPHTRDFGLGGLRNALTETVACMPVYRCYVNTQEVSESDTAVVREAIDMAKRRTAAADTSVFDFVFGVLTLNPVPNAGPEHRRRLFDFVMRVQQFTGPVAAKGVEDTAFYRYARLIALNEVGCHPDAGCLSAESFHRASAERQRRSPLTMLGSSTHDSKRSEDVRARIGVLSELAPEWTARVKFWSELNEKFRAPGEGDEGWPDRGAEYFLYQTLVGVWPLECPAGAAHQHLVARLQAYMRKAGREAKRHTSWLNENPGYEEAVESFIATVLDRGQNPEFLADFESFQARVSTIGLYTSLSQTLLRMTAPGVPDIYQGNELWRFDLVDPDNRRTVDFAHREKMLTELRKRTVSPALAGELLDELHTGAAKLHVIHRALSERREWPAVFSDGDYIPLTVTGTLRVYLCAFARRDETRTVVVLAPRWFSDLSEGGTRRPLGRETWRDTRVMLPATASPYTDLLTGATFEPDAESHDGGVEVGRLLADFPVALLGAASAAQGSSSGQPLPR